MLKSNARQIAGYFYSQRTEWIWKEIIINYLPNMVSGWAVKICGLTTKRVPSTRSVTFSGAWEWMLLPKPTVLFPNRSGAMKGSWFHLFPLWKQEPLMSSGSGIMWGNWRFAGWEAESSGRSKRSYKQTKITWQQKALGKNKPCPL